MLIRIFINLDQSEDNYFPHFEGCNSWRDLRDFLIKIFFSALYNPALSLKQWAVFLNMKEAFPEPKRSYNWIEQSLGSFLGKNTELHCHATV